MVRNAVNILAGGFGDDDHATFWVDDISMGRLGVVTLEDLMEDAPLVLRALTTHVFEQYPNVNRFEGQTREDNIAMRTTFLRAGFIKETHYR